MGLVVPTNEDISCSHPIRVVYSAIFRRRRQVETFVQGQGLLPLLNELKLRSIYEENCLITIVWGYIVALGTFH